MSEIYAKVLSTLEIVSLVQAGMVVPAGV